jgi:hypothetical protein
MDVFETRSSHIYQELLAGDATAEEYAAVVEVEVDARLGLKRRIIESTQRLGMVAARVARHQGVEINGWEEPEET